MKKAPIILGVLLVGALAWLPAGCRSHVMDGPGMEYWGGDSPDAVLADFNGTWMTEDSRIGLTIEDGTVTLSYRDELDAPQTVTLRAELREGTLAPGEGEERLGFYSSIRKKGRFLYGADARTGREDAFAKNVWNFKPDNIWAFDGTWLTRDGDVKLVIRKGKVKEYRRDSETGRYALAGSCTMEFDNGGDRALHPAKGDRMPGPAGYSRLEKRGDLLWAILPQPDVPEEGELFALEGHEEDFPPPRVYVGAAEEVADRRLMSLTLSAGCPDGDRPEAFVFRDLSGCEEASELELKVTLSRLTGEKWVTGAARGGDGAEAPPLREVHYRLTEEGEEALVRALLAPGLLEHNPCRDSGGGPGSALRFTLEAQFASGEELSMVTRYGVPGEEEVLKLAALLLDGGT